MRFALVLLVALPTPALAEDLAVRTHSFVASTGSLVPEGKAQVAVHQVGMWNDLAFGATDWMELSFGTMLWPSQAGVGHIKIRPTPRDFPLRVTIGGGLGLLKTDLTQQPVGEAAVTVAYQWERVNVHGSIAYLRQPEPVEYAHNEAGTINVGAAVQIADHVGLAVELYQSRWRNCSGAWFSCSPTADAGRMLITGVKLMGSHLDADLGVGLYHIPGDGDDDGDQLIPFPAVSLTWRP